MLANGQQGVYSSCTLINPYNLELMEVYAAQSIKSGLAAFGRTGLLSLRGKVPDKALDKGLANFEQLLNARRNSMEVLLSR